MGKSVKYTPLRLVERHSLAIREFEKGRVLRVIGGAEDEVGVACDYAVNRIYELNGIRTGQKLTPELENRVLYQSYDYAIATVVAAYWRRCKQVFTFSKEFYEMLLDMDDFEIGWSLFDHLPYEGFYLELQDHELVEGIMVRYTRAPKRSILYTICGKAGKTQTINSGIVDPRESASYKSFFETEVYCSKADMNNPHVVMVRQILAFVLQACMYLCAKNADIVENELQKNIYRKPTTTIKDKFSEIQKWDVGVRVVREHKAAARGNQVAGEAAGERRRPRQHWRKAHWHTYWVGKGRSTKELKFIAPVLVNDTDDDAPVVVHK